MAEKERKEKLAASIRTAKTAAADLLTKVHKVVAEAHLQKVIAESAERIYAEIPDDSFLSPEAWDRDTRLWDTTASKLSAFGQHFEPVVFEASTSATAISSIGFAYSGAFLHPLPAGNREKVQQEIRALNDVLNSSSWDKLLSEHFIRLGIDRDGKEYKSGLTLIRVAQTALSRPSGTKIDATAVLIPAREAINVTLADLLRKRPRQEQAKSLASKIGSIFHQLKYDWISPDEMDILANQADNLISQLSNAKQKELSDSEIIALFAQSRAFLKAFLSSIDEKKLR